MEKLVDGTPTYLSCGTVFRITPAGALTTLHTFELTDGDGPSGTSFRPLMGFSMAQPEAAGPAKAMAMASVVALYSACP